MKETFGKWFLDVAKYILTAMLLASVFTDMEKSLMLTLTLIGFAISLTIGYLLLRQADIDKEKREKRKSKKRK
ncbi:MAG: hypothetical protein IJ841_09580 [Prevotella sp.]|nr:hypothetical protein [Prevotella sp.]